MALPFRRQNGVLAINPLASIKQVVAARYTDIATPNDAVIAKTRFGHYYFGTTIQLGFAQNPPSVEDLDHVQLDTTTLVKFGEQVYFANIAFKYANDSYEVLVSTISRASNGVDSKHFKGSRPIFHITDPKEVLDMIQLGGKTGNDIPRSIIRIANSLRLDAAQLQLVLVQLMEKSITNDLVSQVIEIGDQTKTPITVTLVPEDVHDMPVGELPETDDVEIDLRGQEVIPDASEHVETVTTADASQYISR